MYLQTIMSNYLTESNKFEVEEKFKPVKVKNSSWDESDKVLKKSFDFEDQRRLERFIIEIVKYKRESTADFEFRCRKNKIGILIHALAPTISEIELEAAKDIDKIKKDVMYYYADWWWHFAEIN